VGIPAQLVRLRAHQEDRTGTGSAADHWREGGWVFTTPTGDPLNPNTDYHQWKELLRTADLRDARLHDARHTAATVLLILESPSEPSWGSWAGPSTGMTRRYQHVTDPIRRTVVDQVDGLLWGDGEAVQRDGSSRSDRN